MPVALALIFCIVIFAVVLVGIVWALVLLVPFYAYVGFAVYLVWRSAQKQAEFAAAMQRESQRQRSLNEQETQAWTTLLETEQRKATKRDYK